jgi:thiosulfate/3-mercaptopyruvate sulfurtransferase
MKKLPAVLLGIILSAVLIGFLSTGEMHADNGKPQYAHPEALASTDWLQTHLMDNDIRIVDCTVSFINPDSYNKGHIPGAVSLDVIGQLSDPKGRVPLLILPESQFENLMGELGIGNDTTVVVYDEFGGSWAAKLWWALMYYGHDNVKILNGGLGKWKTEGREIETAASVATPTVFKAKTQASLLADIEDVKQAIEQDNIYLVDALNADHHFGRKPFSPSTAPPGHIPSAINIPGPSNINTENGLLLAPVELKEHWSKLKANPQDKVITYCGAGYGGAFDLFALYQLGYNRVSLYDGSWIEWISDKTRPIATE